MTVSSSACSTVALGNGATTVWTYDFIIPFQEDGATPAVQVYIEDVGGNLTLLSWNADFTIAGIGDPAGGTVTYPLSGSPLVTGSSIIISRALDYTQPFAVPNQSFLPNTVEQLGDWLEEQIQQLRNGVLSSVRGQSWEVLNALPAAPMRAGKALSFDGSGQPSLLPFSIVISSANLQFETLAIASAATIPGGAQFLQLMGYYAKGDCETVTYKKSAGSGAATGRFQSADGAWWDMVPGEKGVNVRALGAHGTGVDDTAILNAADVYATANSRALLFPAGTYGVAATGITRHGCDWIGEDKATTTLSALAQSFSADTGMVTGTSISGHLTTGLTFNIASAILASSVYWCLQFITSDNWKVVDCAFTGIKAHVLAMAVNGGSHWKVNNNYFNQPTPSTSQSQALNVSVSAGAVSDYEFCDNVCIGTGMFSNGAFGRVARNFVSGWAFGSGLTFGPLVACIGQVICDNICQNSGSAIDVNSTYPLGIECWSAYSNISGNICFSCAGSGILAANTNMVISGNTCFNNGKGVTASSGSGIAVYAVLNGTPFVFAHSIVVGNNCFDTQGTPTQQYGYAEFFVSGTTTMQDNVISGNQFNLNATGTMHLETDAHAPGRGFSGPSVWITQGIAPGTINAGVVFTALSGVFCYGARLGDVVTCSYDQDLKGCTIWGYAQATNNVFVYIKNETGGNQALTAGNVRVRCSKFPGYADFE